MTTSLHPSCGKCGYCVRELQSFVCPECGSDLREVGVLSDRQPQAKRRAYWMIVWTILLPLPVCLLSVILVYSILPCPVHAQVQRYIDWRILPLDATMFFVQKQGDAWQRGANPDLSNRITVPLTRMTITMSSNVGNPPPLEVDLKTGGYHFVAKGVTVERKSGFGKQAVYDWIAANGVDFSNIRVQLGAGDLWTFISQTNPVPINSMGAGPTNVWRDVMTNPVYEFQMPGPIMTFYWPALWGFWIALWLAGVWRISRRRMISLIAPAGLHEAGPG